MPNVGDKPPEAFGILDKEDSVAPRAAFIVEPDNVVQHVKVNGLNIGRDPAEALRIFDARETGELRRCNQAGAD